MLQPLGRWVNTPHQMWTWFFSPDNARVYRFTPHTNTWMSFHPVPLESSRRLRSSKTWYSLLQGEDTPAPTVACPTTIRFITNANSVYFYSSPSSTSLPEPPLYKPASIWPSNTAPPFLEGSDPFFQYLLGPPSSLHINTLNISQEIQVCTLLACSDGSFHPTYGRGTHGWVIASNTGNIVLQGAGPMSGHPDLSSAYRAELSGLVCILYILQRICRHPNVTTGQVTIYCDNKGALKTIFHSNYIGISPFLMTDSDLITVAKDLLRQTAVQIKSEWVKGHSTAKHKSDQEEMNILADSLASDYSAAPHNQHRPSSMPLPHPNYCVRLIQVNSTITSKLHHTMLTSLKDNHIQQHIIRKAKWLPHVFSLVY